MSNICEENDLCKAEFSLTMGMGIRANFDYIKHGFERINTDKSAIIGIPPCHLCFFLITLR